MGPGSVADLSLASPPLVSSMDVPGVRWELRQNCLVKVRWPGVGMGEAVVHADQYMIGGHTGGTA